MVNFSSDKRGPYIRNPVQLDTLSKSIYAGAATVSVIYDLLAKQAFAFVLWVTHLSYSVTYNTCVYIPLTYPVQYAVLMFMNINGYLPLCGPIYLLAYFLTHILGGLYCNFFDHR